MKLFSVIFMVVLIHYKCTAQIKTQLDSVATFPCVAYAIAKHESNLGKSKLAKRTNNVYGLKSKAYRVGQTKGKYSIYKSVEHSVLAYVEFEKRVIQNNPHVTSGSQYLKYISRFYAHKNHRTIWLKQIKSIIEICHSETDSSNLLNVGN